MNNNKLYCSRFFSSLHIISSFLKQRVSNNQGPSNAFVLLYNIYIIHLLKDKENYNLIKFKSVKFVVVFRRFFNVRMLSDE